MGSHKPARPACRVSKRARHDGPVQLRDDRRSGRRTHPQPRSLVMGFTRICAGFVCPDWRASTDVDGPVKSWFGDSHGKGEPYPRKSQT
jgi:hypothetical protein